MTAPADTRPRHHLDPEPVGPAAPVRQWPHSRDDCDDCGERDADLEATWRGYTGTPPRWCSSCAGRSIADLTAGVGPVMVRAVEPGDEGQRPAGAAAPVRPAPALRGQQGAPFTVNGAPVTVHRAPDPARPRLVDVAEAPAPPAPAASPAATVDGTQLAADVVEALSRPWDGYERMLTPTDVAGYLRLSTHTVRRWCSDGTLPAVKVGSRVRVRESELREFVKRSKG